MCNCIKELEKKAKERFEKEISGRGIAENSWTDGMENVAYMLDDGTNQTYQNIRFDYRKIKKDGTPEQRCKTINLKYLHTYCPFCGEKTEHTEVDV